MNLVEDYIYLVAEANLLEMANLPTLYTGLAPTVMISTKYFEGKESQHAPRIKVSNVGGKFSPTDHFVMTVSHEPRVIGTAKLSGSQMKDLHDWVKLNHDHLVDVWHNGLDIDPIDVVNKFKKIWQIVLNTL